MVTDRHTSSDFGILFTSQGGAFPLSLLLPRMLLNTRYRVLAHTLPFLGLNRQSPTSQLVRAQSHVTLGSMPWNSSEPAVWLTNRDASPHRPSTVTQQPDRGTPPPHSHPLTGTTPPLPASDEHHLHLLSVLSPMTHLVVQRQMQANIGRRETRNATAPRSQLASPQVKLAHFNLIRQIRLGGTAIRQLLTMNLWRMLPLATPAPEDRTSQPDIPLMFGTAQWSAPEPTSSGPHMQAGQNAISPTVLHQVATPVPKRSAQSAHLVWRSMVPQEEIMAQRVNRVHLVEGQQESVAANPGEARQAPGPYTEPPLAQIISLQETITQKVERQISVEIARQRLEMERELSRQTRNIQSRDARQAASAPAAIVSDDLVQVLLQKMRALLQDERFRQGYIR